MFTLFEWYFLASMGYPVGSFLHACKKAPKFKQDIMKVDCKELQGIDFSALTTQNKPPVYVGVSNTFIPVGGGSDFAWKHVDQTATAIYDNPHTRVHYPHCSAEDIVRTHKKTSYISDAVRLQEICKNVGMYEKIPITIPMRLDYYKVPGPVYNLYHYFDTDPTRLLRTTLFKYRWPFTLTVPAVALTAYYWFM